MSKPQNNPQPYKDDPFSLSYDRVRFTEHAKLKSAGSTHFDTKLY